MHTKTGLNYFPFDIDFFQDDKIQLISAEFQTRGEIVIIRLLCKIYQHGYYYKCTDDEIALLARSIGDGSRASDVREIILAAIKRRIFDQSLFENYQILTSAGIQKRYVEAISRRKIVEMKSDYLLINFRTNKPQNIRIVDDILDENANIESDSSDEDVNILIENVDTMNTDCKHSIDSNTENDNILKQSKVKESKVKESRVKHTGGDPPKPPGQPPKTNFNEKLLEIFAEEFEESREFPFPLTHKRRDSQHMNNIYRQYMVLKKSRGETPSTEQVYEEMRILFRESMNLIDDKWIYDNLNPTTLDSKFSVILTKIKEQNNGKRTKKPVSTDRTTEIVSNHFPE